MALPNELRTPLADILKDVVWPNDLTLDSVVDAILSVDIATPELAIALTQGMLESIQRDTERFQNDKSITLDGIIDSIKMANEAHLAQAEQAELDPNTMPAGTISLPTEAWPCFMVGDAPKVKLLHPDAVVPARAHPTDVGLNLTPISVYKQLRNDTWLLGTGVAIKPPVGFYYDLAGRSSISKTELMVANACGYIDETYRGDLLIAVTPKVGVDLKTFNPEMLLGNAIAQLVLRPLIITKDPVVVDELDETVRGDGGFGSTDELLKQKAMSGVDGTDESTDSLLSEDGVDGTDA
ncbi:MAG: hypothetical protein GY833_22460 [Aestuariibacter sp.]|nr:hypothetical protein [Aestuariibacter sp.]|tara:strand:+ start:263577 stop:264461 length:885 start_codon:yes stop_codon:yes gene_type:complete